MPPENDVRRMDTRELFDTAFRLYRVNLGPLLRINLAYVAILVAGNFLASQFVLEGKIGGLAVLATSLAQLVIYAAVVIAASNAVLGRPVRAANALNRALAPRLLGKLFLLALPFALLEIFIHGPGQRPGSLLVLLYGGMFALLLSLILRISLLFASPVSILEKRRLWDTLIRVWTLSIDNFRKSFITYGLLFVIPYQLAQKAFPLLVEISRSLISLLSTGSLPQPIQGNFIFFFISQGFLALAVFFLNPFGNLLATLLYYDARVRKENYDEELLAEELGYQPVVEWIPD